MFCWLVPVYCFPKSMCVVFVIPVCVFVCLYEECDFRVLLWDRGITYVLCSDVVSVFYFVSYVFWE